jgi:hypothetical protein
MSIRAEWFNCPEEDARDRSDEEILMAIAGIGGAGSPIAWHDWLESDEVRDGE